MEILKIYKLRDEKTLHDISEHFSRYVFVEATAFMADNSDPVVIYNHIYPDTLKYVDLVSDKRVLEVSRFEHFFDIENPIDVDYNDLFMANYC